MRDDVEYKDIPEHEGYRVGTDGSVWSCWKKHYPKGEGRKGCQAYMSDEWHQLNPHPDYAGYLIVTLKKNGVRVYRKVHQLVLEAFVGPAPKGMVGRHTPDPNPANNNLTNLKWGTPKQNSEDREKMGRTAKGEKVGGKLDEETVRRIRYAHSELKASYEAISFLLQIAPTTVSQVVTRETYAYID